jgi:c-di-GMP-binding flagellar brake protein YcgR
MGTLALTRRKAQLHLLSEACRHAARARIVRRPPGGADRFRSTRLVALDPGGVLVLAPDDETIRQAPSGTGMQVLFEHLGERYAFGAQTRGLEQAAPGPHPAMALLRLSLPLRVERHRQRQHFRLSLKDGPLIRARLTSVLDDRLALDLRLTDISAGGFAGTVERATAERLDQHAPFWADFELPGDPQRFEYVVRPVRRRPAPARSLTTAASGPDTARSGAAPAGEQTSVGWIFCGCDDPATYAQNMARLQRFVAEQRKLRARPVDAGPPRAR